MNFLMVVMVDVCNVVVVEFFNLFTTSSSRSVFVILFMMVIVLRSMFVFVDVCNLF